MNVVIATDGEAAAKHAMDEALRLLPLRNPGVHVTLVSVIDPEQRIGANADATDDLSRGRAVLEAAGIRAGTSLRRGKFAEQILAAGEELKADVIVLGTEQRSWLTRALLGSVAAEVMTKWHGTVLIVKHG